MWHWFGPIFFILVGLFLFSAAKGYTKEYHEEQDWKNQVWGGVFTRHILGRLPDWFFKVLFFLIGLGMIIFAVLTFINT
jgi:hypothetical protein